VLGDTNVSWLTSICNRLALDVQLLRLGIRANQIWGIQIIFTSNADQREQGVASGNSNRRTGRVRTNKFSSPSPASELSAALSASLRAELLREIEGLVTADDAALWAHRRLPAKNQLSATDTQRLEEAFAAN
jgi:hypothetical protein